MANSNTAEAPIGATMRGKLELFPSTALQINAVHAIPASAPRHAINRSPSVAPARIGEKKWMPRLRSVFLLKPSIGDVWSEQRRVAWHAPYRGIAAATRTFGAQTQLELNMLFTS